jgi:hypothetical protein
MWQSGGSSAGRAPGWTELPNTKMRTVCPPNGFGGAANLDGSPYPFASFCRFVTEAWNGAAYSEKANQLVLWGGGHSDYWGNEIYTLDLGAAPPKVSRVSDPTTKFGFNSDDTDRASNCRESYADGRVSSRHTYDALEYVPGREQIVLVGGSMPRCGFFANDTWLLNLSDFTWRRQETTGTPPAKNVLASAYDPVSGKLYLHDTTHLYSYDLESRVWTRLSEQAATDYHLTPELDPVRRKLVLVGSGQSWYYDLKAPGRIHSFPTKGAEALVSAPYPGLAYHPPSGKIVGWAGGDTVYSLDVEEGIWTPHEYENGPGAQIAAGTHGRWRWASGPGSFVVVNSVDANAFLFRLPPIE